MTSARRIEREIAREDRRRTADFARAIRTKCYSCGSEYVYFLGCPDWHRHCCNRECKFYGGDCNSR